MRGSDCAGGKRSKERLTVAVLVNAAGDFEKSLVIGHAAKPRCFSGIEINKLPVQWTHNRKAWMTRDIFEDWVIKFNKKMRAEKRHVLLLVDNAPSHPSDLKLSHVKIQFLPANTTSVLQPLDLEIIKNIKCHYRTRLLRSVLAKLKTSQCASEVARSVNVLDACSWISSAVKEVKRETVVKCFVKAGVIPKPDVEFDDEDDLPLSQLLLSELHLAEPLSVEDYADIDADVPATEELPEGWEKQLGETFLSDKDIVSDSVDSTVEQLEDDSSDRQPTLLINSYAEALHWATQLKLFAADRGHDSVMDFATGQEKVEKTVVESRTQHSKQTSISSFFKPV